MQRLQSRQIGNVLRWSTLALSLSLISGCASFWPFGKSEVKPIEIQTKQVERTRLNLSEPRPLKAREFEWVVVTPDNIEEVWKSFKENNVDLVIFALTDDGYQELAMTMAEVRNYIAAQRAIILKYKEYYEPPKEEITK